MIDFKKLECRDVVEVSDCGVYTVGISFPYLSGNKECTWIDQIECHADTKEEALALRAKIATALGKYATEDEQPSHQGDEMIEQPEALELISLFELEADPESLYRRAATELRRLHAVESSAKVELMHRDNLIHSLHGLSESYRTQVESLQVEISRLQSAPVAAVPALVQLSVLQYNRIPELNALRPSLYESIVRAIERESAKLNGLTVGGSNDGGAEA